VKQDWEIKPSWLLGLYAVALVARLVDLNSQLWADEYLSLVRYVRLPAWDLFTHFYSNNQHPLYSLLAHATMSVFGEAAWTLRLPAALLGAACVPALYALARRVTTRREAFLTTALLALSYHHVWFSQNGRGYTGIMLGGIVCTTLLLDGLRTPRPRTFILYGLVAGLGAYTHLGMVFIVVGHAAAVAPVPALEGPAGLALGVAPGRLPAGRGLHPPLPRPHAGRRHRLLREQALPRGGAGHAAVGGAGDRAQPGRGLRRGWRRWGRWWC
jgi:mannosyltransferase